MNSFIATPSDFSFVECVNAHGWKSLKPFIWDEETSTLTRVEDFGEPGIAELIIASADGAINVSCDIEAPESDIIRCVQRMLQLDLPIDTFHEYCMGIPYLTHIPPSKQGRMLHSPTLWEDIVKVIATTNTTWAQTKGMVARIVDNFGSELPTNPSKRAFPSPAKIASLTLEEFGETARLGYRNASVHKVATNIADGSLDLDRLTDSTLSTSEFYKNLLSLPGIGPYAASCLMIYSGRYDRVNVDSWARTLVGNEIGQKVTDKEAHAFFEEFGEWKALVYHFYKWRQNKAKENGDGSAV